MKSPRMIFDDEFLRAAWHSSVSVAEIAIIYGTSRAAIYRAVSRFGIGERWPVENPRPEGYGAELLWSAGRWSILDDIAQKYGRTTKQVQADFHRVSADERANRKMEACRSVSDGTESDAETDSDRIELQCRTGDDAIARLG